jgi:hypothetical protein
MSVEDPVTIFPPVLAAQFCAIASNAKHLGDLQGMMIDVMEFALEHALIKMPDGTLRL